MIDHTPNVGQSATRSPRGEQRWLDQRAMTDWDFIVVTPALIRGFGPAGAIILQDIFHTSQAGYVGGELGQTRMSQAVIAERTGMSRDAVYRETRKLIDRGVITATQETPTAPKSYVVDKAKIEEAIERWEPER